MIWWQRFVRDLRHEQFLMEAESNAYDEDERRKVTAKLDAIEARLTNLANGTPSLEKIVRENLRRRR